MLPAHDTPAFRELLHQQVENGEPLPSSRTRTRAKPR